jgi:hypothetical protein
LFVLLCALQQRADRRQRRLPPNVAQQADVQALPLDRSRPLQAAVVQVDDAR